MMSEPTRRGWPWRRQTEEEDDGDAAAAADAQARSPLPDILMEESALRAKYKTTASPSFMFISLFGMTGEAIARRAESVDEELAAQGVIPVYLVDEPEFFPLRAERRLFEYLPSPWRAAQRSPDLDWAFYLRRRYLLLQAKWQPIGRIDFGDLPDWLPEHQELVQAPDARTPRL
jgi:hypothetical protein